jgi:hypothetical protein
VTDWAGNPNVANIAVQNETSGEVYGSIVEDGVFALQVPAGRYRAIGQVLDGGWNMDAVTTFAVPGTEVTKDTEVAVSAVDAKPVTISADDPTARPDIFAGGTGVVSSINGLNGPGGAAVLLGGGPTVPMYAKGSPEIPAWRPGTSASGRCPWTTVTVLGAQGYEITSPISMKAGERRSVCMYCAPFGPELAVPQADPQTGKPLPRACRQGDKLTFDVPMMRSRDPATFTIMDPTDQGTTVLSRDRRQVGRNNAPGKGVYDIPSGTGRYTLVSEATKNLPDWPLSMRTKAERAFTTTPSAERKPLPPLDVRFDLPLDGFNSVPANGVTRFVEVGQQTLVALRKPTVDVSFDDGTSWRPVKVVQDGSRWKVEIPGGTGFASLRATAADVTGNSVTETMIRAYRVN